MSYLNNKKRPLDPRDTEIDLEKGVIYEMGNRKEEMYHWGAAVTDYCDMPVEEYMKPPVFAVAGSVPTPTPTPTPGPDSGSTSGDTSGSTAVTKSFAYGYIKKSTYDANPQSVSGCDTVQFTTVNKLEIETDVDVVQPDEYNPDIDIEDEDEYQAYLDSFNIYIVFLSETELEDIELAGASNIDIFSKSTITLNGKQYHVYLNETRCDSNPYNYNIKFLS